MLSQGELCDAVVNFDT